MRTFLQHDTDAGLLYLVMADYYSGQHERTAYTVINDDGTPVRRGAEFDGLAAYREPSGIYRTRRSSSAGWMYFRTMAGERSATERTPCPRATNRRRKCAICASEDG